MFGRDSLQTASPTVGEARLLSQQRSDAFKQKKKETYDKTHRPLALQIGDLVKRRIPANRPDVKKLSPKYEGPFKVIALRGPVNSMIAVPDETHANAFPIHVSQLEPNASSRPRRVRRVQ